MKANLKKQRSSKKEEKKQVNLKKRMKKQPDYKKTTRKSKKTKRSKYIRRKKNKARRISKEIIISLLISFFLLMGIQHLTFSLPKMTGYSMMRTINDGDRLFVNKLGENSRFKLVYYQDESTGETSIRRIIGLPGERIRYIKDQLYVNEQPVLERYLEPILVQLANETIYTEDFTLDQLGLGSSVPEKSFFLLGDNRLFATDSRTFGYVKEKNIIGTVEMRLLPIHALKQY